MTDHMTQADLDAIRARSEAATPGPWTLNKLGRYEDHDECCINLPDDDMEIRRYENGEFIARARTDIPRLLAEVERLTAERDAAMRRAEAAEARLQGADSRTELAMEALGAVRATDVPMDYASYSRLFDLIDQIVPEEGSPADEALE